MTAQDLARSAASQAAPDVRRVLPGLDDPVKAPLARGAGRYYLATPTREEQSCPRQPHTR